MPSHSFSAGDLLFVSPVPFSFLLHLAMRPRKLTHLLVTLLSNWVQWKVLELKEIKISRLHFPAHVLWVRTGSPRKNMSCWLALSYQQNCFLWILGTLLDPWPLLPRDGEGLLCSLFISFNPAASCVNCAFMEAHLTGPSISCWGLDDKIVVAGGRVLPTRGARNFNHYYCFVIFGLNCSDWFSIPMAPIHT